MTDPDKLMAEAKAVLERAKGRLAIYVNEQMIRGDESLIYDLAKVVASFMAQEEARWGKQTVNLSVAGPLVPIEHHP